MYNSVHIIYICNHKSRHDESVDRYMGMIRNEKNDAYANHPHNQRLDANFVRYGLDLCKREYRSEDADARI